MSDNGDYMDPSQWQRIRGPGPVIPQGRPTRLLGRRHMIHGSLQPGPVACFCPLARDHDEAEFYEQSRHNR